MNVNSIKPPPQASDRFFARQQNADQEKQGAESNRQQGVSNDRAGYVAGKISSLKFDFFYEKVVSSSRQASFVQGDSARTVSHNLYQRVNARFSLDFSSIMRLADQTGRAAGIDEETFDQFVEAANGLTRLTDESLNLFLSAVDDVLNSAENALGLASDGLDPMADFIKDGVKSFFTQVASIASEIDAREEHAAQKFQNALSGLFMPKEEQARELKDFEAQLQDAAIPEQKKISLLKVALLLLQQDEKGLRERADRAGIKLKEVMSRLLDRATKSNDERRDQTGGQVAQIEVYESVRSAERLSLNVEQSQNTLAIA